MPVSNIQGSTCLKYLLIVVLYIFALCHIIGYFMFDHNCVHWSPLDLDSSTVTVYLWLCILVLYCSVVFVVLAFRTVSYCIICLCWQPRLKQCCILCWQPHLKRCCILYWQSCPKQHCMLYSIQLPLALCLILMLTDSVLTGYRVIPPMHFITGIFYHCYASLLVPHSKCTFYSSLRKKSSRGWPA